MDVNTTNACMQIDDGQWCILPGVAKIRDEARYPIWYANTTNAHTQIDEGQWRILPGVAKIKDEARYPIWFP
jgi:hypothetical protein